ncbi:MAG: alanine racemase [Christensenellaceae bacterium]|jgi:alanine racemase|nr:alanine racemase [Christensenellaceae bacterium]
MDHVLATARTWAQIDLAALKHNFEYAQRQSGKKVMCVIKADAYGHGAVRCGQYLQAQGAQAFAVACLAEAIELREGGIQAPILILGYTGPEYAELLAKYSIAQAVQGERSAALLAEHARKANACVKVHIKVDTGMSRMGIYAQGEQAALNAAEEIARIYALRGIYVEGVFTHFSVADTPEEDGYTAWQLRSYTTVLEALGARGIRPEIRHASNSAAIMAHPEAHLDMVREGIMLYGLYPDSSPCPGGPLRPVLTLKSRVAQVQDLPGGASISYGRTYTSEGPLRTAAIAAGYADGYPRRLSGQGYACIGGKAYKQVGRICMDTHMLDITGSEGIQPGDEVALWGAEGMRAEEVAQIVGTINYELTCLVTRRAPRVYVNE